MPVCVRDAQCSHFSCLITYSASSQSLVLPKCLVLPPCCVEAHKAGALQVLDAGSRQSIPSVMRWYNTMLSHANISEFTGALSSPPVTSSASSQAASHSQTNGVVKEKSKENTSSGSRNDQTPGQKPVDQQSSSGEGQQDKLKGKGDGQQDKPKDSGDGQQGKPKGKDAKGGKLAKNDVAKGQKKGGDKKDKPSQAPKGACLLHLLLLLPCYPIPAATPAILPPAIHSPSPWYPCPCCCPNPCCYPCYLAPFPPPLLTPNYYAAAAAASLCCCLNCC